MIDSIVYKSIVYHITLTVFQNTPDTLVPPLAHFSPGWSIPHWRFFAPNPGTSNHHILYRAKENNREQWGDWEELIPSIKPNMLSAIWNPNGRYLKANFDMTNLLISMINSGASFELIKTSETYLIITEILRNQLESLNVTEFQFLVATSTYDKSAKNSFIFEPKFFSEIHQIY